MTQQLAEKFTYKRTFVTEDTLTIAAGQTTSSIFDCGGMQLRALLFPSNWTSCNITLHPYATPNGSSYLLPNVDGSSLTIATVAGQWLPFLFYITDSIPYLQVVCSIPQVSAVVIGSVLQPFYQGVHG